MVEDGTDLWRSSDPPLLLKQGHLEEAAITIADCNYLLQKTH